MRLLLDTHIWLWLAQDPTRLAAGALEDIRRADELLLSAASIWEMAIKATLGKLSLEGGVSALVYELEREMGASELPIRSEHALAAGNLPLLHRDPFDRMLVAQARVVGAVLVTADEGVRAYGGALRWALS